MGIADCSSGRMQHNSGVKPGHSISAPFAPETSTGTVQCTIPASSSLCRGNRDNE